MAAMVENLIKYSLQIFIRYVAKCFCDLFLAVL